MFGFYSWNMLSLPELLEAKAIFITLILWANPKQGTTFVQMCLFNDADHTNLFPFIWNVRQVKMKWGASRREGEKEQSRLSEWEKEHRRETDMA